MPAQRATAHAPLRPNIRLDVDPAYGLIQTEYGSAVVLHMELVDPETNTKETIISIPETADISLYPKDIDWDLIESDSTLSTSAHFAEDEAKKFLLVIYGSTAQEAFDQIKLEPEELAGASDGTAQKTIDELRNLCFTATTEDREYTYTIDFDDYPDHHSIGRRLNRSNGISVPFALTREAHS